MPIRHARPADVDAMVNLAEQQRQQYQVHAPTFHRPAPNATAIHRPWFQQLVEDDAVATLVHDDERGTVDGFLVGTLVPAPPVYDPGGMTCSVDDFMVANPAQWDSVGLDLLRAAQEWSRRRGAVQTVVVCGPQDQPKRQMLFDSGLQVASEWFTEPLDSSS